MIREAAFLAMFWALKIIAPVGTVMIVLAVLWFYTVIALSGLYVATVIVEQIQTSLNPAATCAAP